ncbi:MAG TPA: hypothetical protein PKY38_12515 [Opitutaceae bacterium]|nr:hypothetical protein [Opitutaceae bacterium]
MPPASSSPDPADKFRRLIARRGLAGLANHTKWQELFAVMRSREGWWPSYRCKTVEDRILGWDTEWHAHVPDPLVIRWLDIAFREEHTAHALTAPTWTDHSAWIEAAIRTAGLDYRRSHDFFRIFGYAPRDLELFAD